LPNITDSTGRTVKYEFEGLLVPAKMVYKENVNDWYRKDCAEIKNLTDRETRYSLFAATLYSSVLNITLTLPVNTPI